MLVRVSLFYFKSIIVRVKIGVRYHPERDKFLLVPEGSPGIGISENVW